MVQGSELTAIIDESKRRKLDRKITGDIPTDRIWEQWYDQKIFGMEFPKMTQKDYLFQCIGEDPDRVILDYRGKRTYTVSQFKELVTKFEKAFWTMSPKEGDVVCTIGLSTPEMYAIKYSCTSLGMITCNLNILDMGIEDNGKNRLERQMENVNPCIIFVSDILEKKVRKVINLPKFKNALKVEMPIDFSFPAYDKEKILLAAKAIRRHRSWDYRRKSINAISLKAFLAKGEKVNVADIKEVYRENLPCNISYTSGTTGINKAVLISHDANNSAAFQHIIGEINPGKGIRQLALVPPFLAFWDAIVVHMSLCLGAENIIELKLDYNEIPKYFLKHEHINVGMWSQYLWSSLETLPKEALQRMSKDLTQAIVGGERSDLNEARAFYKNTGIIQRAGYGASEVNTNFAYTHPNVYKPGTAGIPLPFNNIMIMDEDYKRLTYNQPGRLFITGPCQMNGYYNRPDLTTRVWLTDSDGVIWYNTGDYAVVDEDGCLTVIDRYVPPCEVKYERENPDGTGSEVSEKVNVLDIAEIIKKNPHIKNAKITVFEGKMVLHLSFRTEAIEGEVDTRLVELIEYMRANLPYGWLPDYISVLDELPRTSVGKVNYRELAERGKYICMNTEGSGKLRVCS